MAIFKKNISSHEFDVSIHIAGVYNDKDKIQNQQICSLSKRASGILSLASIKSDLIEKYPNIRDGIESAATKIELKYLKWFAKEFIKSPSDYNFTKIIDYINEFNNYNSILSNKDLYTYDLQSLTNEISQIKQYKDQALRLADEYFNLLKEKRNLYISTMSRQESRKKAYEEARQWLNNIQPPQLQTLTRQAISSHIRRRELGDIEGKNGRSNKEMARSSSDIIYEDQNYLVVLPGTTQASKYFGSGTQWCTAADKDNYFTEYSLSGVYLYYIIDKKNQRSDNPLRKIAWVMSKQNEKPEIKDIFNALDNNITKTAVQKYLGKDYSNIINSINMDISNREDTKFQDILKNISKNQLEYELKALSQDNQIKILKTIIGQSTNTETKDFANKKLYNIAEKWATEDNENFFYQKLQETYPELEKQIAEKWAAEGNSKFFYYKLQKTYPELEKQIAEKWAAEGNSEFFNYELQKTYPELRRPIAEKWATEGNENFFYQKLQETYPELGKQIAEKWAAEGNWKFFNYELQETYPELGKQIAEKWAAEGNENFFYYKLQETYPELGKQIAEKWAAEGNSEFFNYELQKTYPELRRPIAEKWATEGNSKFFYYKLQKTYPELRRPIAEKWAAEGNSKFFYYKLQKTYPDIKFNRMANRHHQISKRASDPYGWWLSPDGKLYEVPFMGHEKFVFMHPEIFGNVKDPYRELLENGEWIRLAAADPISSDLAIDIPNRDFKYIRRIQNALPDIKGQKIFLWWPKAKRMMVISRQNFMLAGNMKDLEIMDKNASLKTAQKKQILMLVASVDFQDQEYAVPKKMFENAGFDVDVASSTELPKSMTGRTIKANLMFDEVDANKYDAVVSVGGKGAKEMGSNPDAQRIVKEMAKKGKLLAGICHGPLVFARSRLVKDKVMTGWPESKNEFEDLGASYTGQEVEDDHGFITGRDPDAAQEFAKTIINRLNKQEKTARKISKKAGRLDYPRKMTDEIVGWIKEVMPDLKKRIFRKPKEKELTKTFNINLDDTDLFRKRPELMGYFKEMQNRGWDKELFVMLYSEDYADIQAAYDNPIPGIHEIIIYDPNKHENLYASVAHELTHMMQRILGSIMSAPMNVGLLGRYNPESYKMYGTESDLERGESIKWHSRSDVEFFSKLNEEIVYMQDYVSKSKDKMSAFQKFLRNNEFLEHLKGYNIDNYRKALRELYRAFNILLESQQTKISCRQQKNIPKIAKDPLAKYKKKRKFNKTPEPEGKIEKGKNKHRFVIQRHKAEKAGEHYDLRIENDEGTMSSWAIPRHSIPSKNDRFLAMATENHPVSYITFGKSKEERITEGYGKGSVRVVASGKYKPISWSNKKIEFEISSGKAKGKFVLVHTDGKKWLWMRTKD